MKDIVEIAKKEIASTKVAKKTGDMVILARKT